MDPSNKEDRSTQQPCDPSTLLRSLKKMMYMRDSLHQIDNGVIIHVMYVLPITSILGRLPVVRAGDTGTIPFSYRNCCRNGAHSYDHDLARADVLREFLGAGLVPRPVKWNEAQCVTCFVPLLHISTGYCILLHHYNMVITRDH